MKRRIGFVCLIAAASLMLPIGVLAGKVVETQQSVSYALPEGWTVSGWTEKTGEAMLKNGKTGDVMQVNRYGATGAPTEYSNSEKIDGGRTFMWEHVDILKSGDFTLSGEVKLDDAIVRMFAARASAPFTGVDKEAALKAMRAIAASVKILGARKCWPPGECPPGTVKEAK